MREHASPFPLEGGKAEIGGDARDGAAKNVDGAIRAFPTPTAATPPSPTLPPSRGKGFDGARPAEGGVKRARRLRKEATVAERLLWSELRKLKLNFRRQAPIGPYVADFAHHGGRLVIEIDGYCHTLPDQAAFDAARTAWLANKGYRVIRFNEAAVRADVTDVVRQIIEALAPFPLKGGPEGRRQPTAGIGGGSLDALARNTDGAVTDRPVPSAATPPSPTLPPSRGKGHRS